MKQLFLIALAAAFCGCGYSKGISEDNKRWKDLAYQTEKKSIENCLNKGKSVIRSSWDGRMKDCR